MQFGFGGGLTPVVRMLLIANGVAFVVSIMAQAAGLGSVIYWLMLTPYRVIHSLAIWQFVTYLFLHGGLFHLLFNMFALWMFGSELERAWGARRFLNYYLVAGIGAGLTVVLVNPNSLAATLGASGAIYGVLLAYGLLYPNRMILVYFFIPVPAKYFVMIIGAIAFLSSLSSPGDGISHLAHLGGLVFGFLYLRGRPYYHGFRNQYYRWRRRQLQQQFQVYMAKKGREEKRKDGDEKRKDRWVN